MNGEQLRRIMNSNLRMTAGDLTALAEQVTALEKAGLNVTEMEVRGHVITLEKSSDERDKNYFVVGIRKLSRHNPKVLRTKD